MSIEKKSIIADMHTHTIFSKHAYSTVLENLEYGHANGMKYVATTDHFYQNGDFLERKNEVVRISYLRNTIKNPPHNMQVISGMEMNLNQDAHKEIELDKIMKNVLWRPIGFHTWFLYPYGVEIQEVPEYFLQTVNGSRPTIIKPTAFCHIERELYKCKYYNDKTMKECLHDIVEIAAKYDIPLEVNESSICNNEVGGVDRLKFWLHEAHEKNVMIYLGSDAHFCTSVGVFDGALELINNEGISPEYILNHESNEDLLKKYIK